MTTTNENLDVNALIGSLNDQQKSDLLTQLLGKALAGKENTQQAIKTSKENGTYNKPINQAKPAKKTKRNDNQAIHPAVRFEQTDDGNAKYFVKYYSNRIRYSYVDKVWYVYNGTFWERDNGNQIIKLARQAVHDMPHHAGEYIENNTAKDPLAAWDRFVMRSGSAKSIQNMIQLAQSETSVDHGEFDKEDYLFNTKNGTIVLEPQAYDQKRGLVNQLISQNGQNAIITDHDAHDMISKCSPVLQNKKAGQPTRFLKFLNQIFMGNKDLVDFVQRCFGYSLSGDTSEQVMFLLVGDGRNGKTVLLNVLEKLMGTYAKTMASSSIMMKRDGATHDLARLEGARVVVSNESNEGERLDESLLKSLTGNDTIVARYLYGSEFEFTPKFKLWMATNHKPIIRGTDKGIWRRLIVIPFKYTIPDDQVDKHLEQKLEQELPAILNWTIDGYYEWRKNGLQIPQIVTDENKDYQKQMNVIDQFANDIIDTETLPKGAKEFDEKGSLLYQLYREWAKRNGAYIMSNVRFGNEMNKKFHKVHKRDGNYYTGICLSEEGVKLKDHLENH